MNRRLLAAGGISLALLAAARAVREGKLLIVGPSARALVSAEREITGPAERAAAAMQFYQQTGRDNEYPDFVSFCHEPHVERAQVAGFEDAEKTH